MDCKTTYVFQKDANKNIMGDLSHEDYKDMMLSHVKETLKRESFIFCLKMNFNHGL
jgi:hypothetical protein